MARLGRTLSHKMPKCHHAASCFLSRRCSARIQLLSAQLCGPFLAQVTCVWLSKGSSFLEAAYHSATR